MGATGATLTLAKLDELIDAVKGGKPDMLLMSRRSRRKINALVRAAGGMTETDRDQWGNFVQLWDGVPIGVNDWILDTHVLAGSVETATTGGTCSTIYAVQLGEGALCGLTSPGHLQVEPVGSLENKDASQDPRQVVRLPGAVQLDQGSGPHRRQGLKIIKKIRGRDNTPPPEEEAKMEKHESAQWLCRYMLSKYREDIAGYRENEAEFYRLFQPYEVHGGGGELPAQHRHQRDLERCLRRLVHGFQQHLRYHGRRRLQHRGGATQTDLQAATNKTYKGMDSGYPTSARVRKRPSRPASAPARPTTPGTNGWSRILPSSMCLNRKVDSLGTKSSGTWTLQVDITLA